MDAPVRLKLIKIDDSAAPYIVYDTKGFYTSKFEAKVEDSVLKIRERTDLKRESVTEVEVYFNTLSEITIAKAGVIVEVCSHHHFSISPYPTAPHSLPILMFSTL